MKKFTTYYLVNHPIKIEAALTPNELYVAGDALARLRGKMGYDCIAIQGPVFKTQLAAKIYAKNLTAKLHTNLRGKYEYPIFTIRAPKGKDSTLPNDKTIKTVLINIQHYQLQTCYIPHTGTNIKLSSVKLNDATIYDIYSKMSRQQAFDKIKVLSNTSPKAKGVIAKWKYALGGASVVTLCLAGVGVSLTPEILIVGALTGAFVGYQIAGVSLVQVIKEIYSTLFPTDKQRYKNNIRTAKKLVNNAIAKLDSKNTQVQDFVITLNGILKKAPKPKFTTSECLAKKQPRCTKLSVLHSLHPRLEKLVNIKRNSARIAQTKRILQKARTAGVKSQHLTK